MTIHSPINNFSAARRAMVESQLRPQGVTDRAVLDAMAAVEREAFLPAASAALAYVDRSLPIGGGRFLLPPPALGELLTGLAPVAGERALVVGAGTGYSAAVLATIGLDVVALECSQELASQARTAGLTVVEGPLELGHPAKAPYDVILLDGAVEHIPQAIIDQMANGGRLGGVLNDRRVGRMIVGRKAGGAFGYLSIGDVGVATLPGFTRPPTFTF